MSNVLRKTFQSPNPAMNVLRRKEGIATDTVYSDVPSIDGGETIAQIYVGVDSEVLDVYGIKTEKQFVKTLEDNIRQRGAPLRLISDSAAVETSARVKDILRSLVIKDWQSEPYHQHQNKAERKYQDLKRVARTIMDRTGAPAHTWLLAFMYVAFILNRTATPSLNNRTPLEALDGVTPDISIMLRFYFFEPVFYRVQEPSFPSETREAYGYFVGFSETVGHSMTYKILSKDSNRVIHRSEVRSAADPNQPNFHATTSSPALTAEEELSPPKSDVIKWGDSKPSMTTFQPVGIIGKTFPLMVPGQEGTQQACVVRAIERHNSNLEDDPDRKQFMLSINKGQYEDIMSYSEILSHIEYSGDRVWRFKTIVGHSGPIHPTHADYKGSAWNVSIEWDTGETTQEALTTIATDDPVACAIYAESKSLLDTEGWKRFRTVSRRQKKLFRRANLARLRSFRVTPKFMYGFEIPRDYRHAVELDRINGNTKWQDAVKMELVQLGEYRTFKDIGRGTPPPDGYKKIRVHLIFAVKHDGRHKARLVADGHLTDVPSDSVYSGVVSLRGLRTVLFLAELNGLPIWSTDIGNAYLEAMTSERVCIVTGPEFGPLKGHTLVIYKALYGLRSSGLRWHEKFADCLSDLGFTQSRAEADIWLRQSGDLYEYVAVYVDDLAMAMRDPLEFTQILTKRYNFKLKGTGPIEFHLGCDFFRDKEGTLCMSPKKYIDKLVDGYTRMFGERPKTTAYAPLDHGDHPEMDSTPLLGPEDVQKYQSLIGSMQWAVSLGRIDIATAVMMMSGFRAAPRQGHLQRAQRMVAYLVRMKSASIRFRTEAPDYSSLTFPIDDWDRSVYGPFSETPIPDDVPTPLGRPVILSHYVDANLYHDWVSGKSVTGVLHFLNKTPIDWHTKKQATVETATYGSEFIAARTCIEQIIALRHSLRYLGVPIDPWSHMFGDNQSVVDSSMRIDAKLHKRHVALSFHFVRSVIASGMVKFYHIIGVINPADILSKHWAYSDVWRVLQPILFWEGDTAPLLSHAVTPPS